MWRLGQAVQSMLTMMLTWRTDQTLAGAISNGLHDGVAKRRRLGHESAVTTYYVQCCNYLPLNAYVLKREGNSVARSLQGGSRPLYASYLRTEHEAVATELLERAAEASASVHAAGKDGWLGKVGRGDVRRGEARETRVCSGLTG